MKMIPVGAWRKALWVARCTSPRWRALRVWRRRAWFVLYERRHLEKTARPGVMLVVRARRVIEADRQQRAVRGRPVRTIDGRWTWCRLTARRLWYFPEGLPSAPGPVWEYRRDDGYLR